MSSLDQFKAKAEQLRAKAQQETSFISRAMLEGLAESYARLADHEARRQIEDRQHAWNKLARENGWRCENGHPIPYSDREQYFETKLCSACLETLNGGPPELDDRVAPSGDAKPELSLQPH